METNYWLYNQVVQNNAARNPRLARESSLNWILALEDSIQRGYGASPIDWRHALNAHFQQVPRRTVGFDQTAIGEALWHSLICSLSVTESASLLDCPPWVAPNEVVSWYYANFHALRAIIASQNAEVEQTHSAVAKRCAQDDIRQKLPHPYDMSATHSHGKKFISELPLDPNAAGANLLGEFDGTAQQSNAFMLGYLNGTCDFEYKKIASQIKRELGVADLRTRRARELRDDRLRNRPIGFMHCAFRFRGKANYRDGIFMTYGSNGRAEVNRFVKGLAATSQFMFLTSVAFVSRRCPRSLVEGFASDFERHLLGRDLRGYPQALLQAVRLS